MNFLTYLLSCKPFRTPLPPSRPRCETAEEPYFAGYEDRMAGNGMSVHAGVYMTECLCVRCTEYRAGWLAAHEDRIVDLDKARKKARGDVGAMHGIVERLTAERDEARREACVSDALYVRAGIYTAKEAAARRGWDCFTTHTNTPDVPVQNGGE